MEVQDSAVATEEVMVDLASDQEVMEDQASEEVMEDQASDQEVMVDTQVRVK
jgi:hypothetical protein